MKIAFGTAQAVNMLEAHVGTANYSRLYQGATKIWPSDRVAKITFRANKIDGSSYSWFVGSATWGYYVHADEGIARAPESYSMYILLTIGGYEYLVRRAFDGLPLATASVDKANDTLVVSFAKGVGPIAEAVSVGKVVTMEMSALSRTLDGLTATKSATSKTYSVPWIPGITATVTWSATANTESLIFTVKDRSNHIWVGIKGYTGGSSSTVTIKASGTGQHPDVSWIGGSDAFTAVGGESMTMSLSALSSVVTSASAVLHVPYFRVTAELTVLSITKE